MSKLPYSILLLLMSLTAAAQNTTVHIRFKELKAPITAVMLPVNETYYFLNKKQYSIDKDSAIHISLHLSQAVSIRCEGYSFIIEPGVTKILIDLNKKGLKAIQYDGISKEGQRLYQQWDPEFYQTASNRYYRHDSTASGMTTLIRSDLNKALGPYDSLLQKGAITPLFYNYVKTTIEAYYAAVMAHVPLALYYNARRKNIRPYLKKEFEELWQQVYKKFPVQTLQSLSSTHYYDYARDYSNYKGLYITGVIDKKLSPLQTNTDEEYFLYTYDNIRQQFAEPFREYMLAFFLGIEMYQDRYQPQLIRLFNQFVKTYPKSNFSLPMQPLIDKIKLFNHHKTQGFTNEQLMVKDYENINSLDQLLNIYKNKTVYIDIWATWCGPCKREFAYNQELKQQLKANGIELLYISMDEADAVEQWNTMIKFYNLQGNHLRASERLKQDLINKLWKGEGYAIPRYLLVKDSKIINDDALRPGDKEQLYKQLKNAL